MLVAVAGARQLIKSTVLVDSLTYPTRCSESAVVLARVCLNAIVGSFRRSFFASPIFASRAWPSIQSAKLLRGH